MFIPKKDLIVLPDFKPDPFCMHVLSFFEKKGFVSPALFGGALRDQFLALPPHDYDVRVYVEKSGEIVRDTMALLDLMVKLLAFPGVKSVFPEVIQGEPWARTVLYVEFENRPLSLFLDEDNRPFEETVRGDAPLNAIAMSPSGAVVAHYLFPDHVRERVYAPFNGSPSCLSSALERRFARLRARIPGLKCLSYE